MRQGNIDGDIIFALFWKHELYLNAIVVGELLASKDTNAIETTNCPNFSGE